MKYILKNENEKDYNYSIIIKHSVREGLAMAQNFLISLWETQKKKMKYSGNENKNFKLQIKHNM